MATTKKTARTVSVIQNRTDAMIAGFTKDFTAKMSLTVEGSAMGQPAILTQLGGIKTLLTNVDATRKALTAAVAAKKAGTPDAMTFLANLETALKAQFGSRNPVLQDFGIALPKTKAKPTAEQQAISVAARRQTRQARGTKGKKQALEIVAQGKPGLVLVTATGQPVPGALAGPVAPVVPAAVAAAPVEAPPSNGAGGGPGASSSSPASASGK